MKLYTILIFLFLSCNTEVVVDIVEESTEIDTETISEDLEYDTLLSKISTSSAIFEGSNNSNDCGYYLIGIRNSQRPTTFVYNNKVYFNIPCKTSDSSNGGWHWGLMTWTPAGGSVWYDADGATAGNQPVLRNKADFDTNGFQISSVRNTFTVDTGSGVIGLTYKYFRNTEYTMANVPALFPANAVVSSSGYYSIGFSSTSPENMLPSDMYVDETKGASSFSLNDNTWKGKTHTTDTELYYDSGTVYVYNTTQNAPTSDTYYISVATSTDMINYNMPTNYMLKDYRAPHVFKYNNKLYMVAFNTSSSQWVLIPGNSLTDFDTDNETELNIGVEVFGTGNWDDTPLFTTHPNNQPEIAGVEVLDGKIYIFYMAGQFGQVRAPANGVTGAPYDSARGIGAFELKIQEE